VAACEREGGGLKRAIGIGVFVGSKAVLSKGLMWEGHFTFN